MVHCLYIYVGLRTVVETRNSRLIQQQTQKPPPPLPAIIPEPTVVGTFYHLALFEALVLMRTFFLFFGSAY